MYTPQKVKHHFFLLIINMNRKVCVYKQNINNRHLKCLLCPQSLLILGVLLEGVEGSGQFYHLNLALHQLLLQPVLLRTIHILGCDAGMLGYVNVSF